MTPRRTARRHVLSLCMHTSVPVQPRIHPPYNSPIPPSTRLIIPPLHYKYIHKDHNSTKFISDYVITLYPTKMASICSDHHHKLHRNLLSSKKTHHLQDLVLTNSIPPRKLIARSSSTDSDDSANSAAYDPETDPYSSDPFRMFEFKIRRCTRSRSHDWTDCPFAHPGEKARRRDPRKFHYSGSVCPDFRRSGSCSRGDECDFAHGVFEVWLHPSRYRTEACKDGKNCKRKVCFFAHSPRELRVLPSDASEGGGGHLLSLSDIMMMGSAGKGTSSAGGSNSNCCKHCTCSPRSTLVAPLSPPSPEERFAWANQHQQIRPPLDELMYEELAHQLDAMNLKGVNFPGGGCAPSNGGLWVDVVGDHGGGGGGDESQFVLSPSTPLSANSRSYHMAGVYGGAGASASFDSPCSAGAGSYSFDSPVSTYNTSYKDMGVEEPNKIESGDPDLGWVNDLLT